MDFSSPDITNFLQYVPRKSTYFGSILREILEQDKNIAVMFLSNTSLREEGIDYLRGVDEITDEQIIEFCRRYMRSSIVDSVKKHLIVMGFIEPSSAHSGSKVVYNTFDDEWELRDKIHI